jgi:hypothetical protein
VGRRKGQRGLARPGLRGDRRGILGAIGVIGSLLLLVMVSMATIAVFSWATHNIGSSFDLKETMIYTPRLRGLPLADQSCFGPSAADSGVLRMEREAGKMYDRVQKVALGLMVGVLFFIGFAFMIEKFAFLQEGTAERLIRESIFILILLFITPVLYNLFASGVNALTVHGVMGAENMREASGTVDKIIGRATDIKFFEAFWANYPTKAVAWFFFGGFTFMTVFGAGLLVLFRLFLTLVAAALLPLILVFRLYPPFQRFSGILVDALIGLVLSVILVGGIIELAQYGWSSGFGGWVFNIGILLACGTVMTLFAPGLGGVVSHASRSVATAVGGAIGGAMAGAATAVGVAGPVGAISATAAAGGAGAGAAMRAMGTGYLRAAGGAMFGAPDLGKSLTLGAQQYGATLDGVASQTVEKTFGGGQWSAVERPMVGEEGKGGLRLDLATLPREAKRIGGDEKKVDALYVVMQDASNVLKGKVSPDERIRRFLDATNEEKLTKLPEGSKALIAFDPKYEPFRREVMAVQDRRLKELGKKYGKAISFLDTPEDELKKVLKKRGLPKNVAPLLSELSGTGLLSKESREILKNLRGGRKVG